MMNVLLKIAKNTELSAIREMMSCHIRDLEAWLPDKESHGNEDVGNYFELLYQSDRGIPFVIYANEEVAGFLLVGSHVYDEIQTIFAETDHYVAELFIQKEARRRGIGSSAARTAFDLLPGRWALAVFAENETAVAFWRQTLGACATGAYAENLEWSPYRRRWIRIFRFVSR